MEQKGRTSPALATSLCLSRESAQAGAPHRAARLTRCPERKRCIQAGRSSPAAGSDAGRARTLASSPPTTPSCMSPWSTPGTVGFCAGWASRFVSSADLVSQFEAVLSTASRQPRYGAAGHRCHSGRGMEADRNRCGPLRHRRAGAYSNSSIRNGSATPCAAKGSFGTTAHCQRQRQLLRLAL